CSPYIQGRRPSHINANRIDDMTFKNDHTDKLASRFDGHAGNKELGVVGAGKVLEVFRVVKGGGVIGTKGGLDTRMPCNVVVF
ncbi:hypothetical protein BaRGS_00013439, partial [Batillaria attramentaria]